MGGWTMAVDGAPVVLAAESDLATVGLLFFLSGFLFYGFMFMKYRNTNKRHMHARETQAEIDNVVAADERTGRRTRQRNSRIKGGNERQIEGAQSTGLAAGFMNGLGGGDSVAKVRRLMRS